MEDKNDKTEKKYIPLYFDALFYKVFGEEDKLDSLIYLIEETLNVKIKDIKLLSGKVLGDNYKTKRSYLDLLVSLNNDTKLNIEINTNTSKATLERNLIFIFKVMGNDIKIKDKYTDLLNYIQINLNLEESKDSYDIEKYVIMEEKNHKKLTEKLQIYKINLSFYANKCYTNGEINKLTDFEKLMGLIGTETQEQYDLFSKEEGKLKEIMKDLDKFRDDSEVIEMYDHDTEMKRIYEMEKQNAVKEESEKYEKLMSDHDTEMKRIYEIEKDNAVKEESEKYKKLMSDHNTEMKRIYEIEKDNAVKEAIDKNTKEVSLNKQKAIACNMLKMNMKIEDISKATGLSIDEVKELNNSK